MNGSAEFTTWVALACAAALAGFCAIFSTSLIAPFTSAAVGGVLGYFVDFYGRAWLSRRLAQKPAGAPSRKD